MKYYQKVIAPIIILQCEDFHQYMAHEGWEM